MDEALACYNPPGWIETTYYRLKNIPEYIRYNLSRGLIRAAVLLNSDSNSVGHARRELASGLADKEEGPNKWIAENLIELVAIFSTQGHSGSSAPYCISAFGKLANFQPLGPLTGEPEEWNEVGDGVFQNRRCSHVFKQADRFDGQAYDIVGRIFREPNGFCYTSADSRSVITFPYTPKSEYVDLNGPAE